MYRIAYASNPVIDNTREILLSVATSGVNYTSGHVLIPRGIRPIRLARSGRGRGIVLRYIRLCFNLTIFWLRFHFVVFKVMAAPWVVIFMSILVFKPFSVVGVGAGRQWWRLNTAVRGVCLSRLVRRRGYGFWRSRIDVGVPRRKVRECFTELIEIPINVFKKLWFCLQEYSISLLLHI